MNKNSHFKKIKFKFSQKSNSAATQGMHFYAARPFLVVHPQDKLEMRDVMT